MKSPFKMTPGRGNMPKTGRGIAPTLMNCSPMKQATTSGVELTGFGRMKQKESQAKVNANPKAQAERDAKMGIKRNFATNELTPVVTDHKFNVAGSFAREIDAEGNLVKEVKLGLGGAKSPQALELKKKVEQRNASTRSDRSNTAEVLNAFGGGTPTEKLSEKQKQMLINSTRAKVSPANQMKKKSPMKQVSKITVKKTTVVPADKKPKASKTPMKQVSKMPTNKARDSRPTDTMERNRAGKEPAPRKVPTSDNTIGGRSVEKNGIAPRLKPSKTPMKQMSKLKKKC